MTICYPVRTLGLSTPEHRHATTDTRHGRADKRAQVGVRRRRGDSLKHWSMKEQALQPLSPREIQARVRAGASPEVVAAETGWPLDKVTRYAGPLLGERAYVAEQAAAVEISRSRGGATLHESVCVKLDVDPDTNAVSWDSLRNPEGRWVVTAFHDGSAIGSWLFEETGRSVHPQDESARALMGGGPSVVAESVPSTTSDKRQPADEPTTTPDVAGEAPQEPAGEAVSRPRLVSVTSDPTVTSTDHSKTDDDQPEKDKNAESSTAALFDEPDATTKRTKRSKGKRGRASVPSWDEILFGTSKNED